MKIGIDIDDVVTETGKMLLKYVYELEPLYCDNHEITNNLKDFMKGNFINEPMKKYVKDNAALAWANVELKPHVLEVLNRLNEQEHELIFITSRANIFDIDAEKVTYEYFAKHKIPYNEIIFGVHNKRQKCLDERIDIFIDDSVDTCNDIFNNTSIKVYLFNSEINKDFDCNALRVNNWLEIEQKINEI